MFKKTRERFEKIDDMLRLRQAMNDKAFDQIQALENQLKLSNYQISALNGQIEALTRLVDKQAYVLGYVEKLQCASYEGAYERLKAMVEFESQKRLQEDSSTIVNLR